MSSQNEGWASPWALKKGSHSVKRHILGRKHGMWKNCKEGTAALSTRSGTDETRVNGSCLKIKRDMAGQAALLDQHQATYAFSNISFMQVDVLELANQVT